MKKSVLIGIAALAVLSLWLVILFGNDSSMVRVSFVAPVYAADDTDADKGGGRNPCTNSCLYDAMVASARPYWPGWCKVQMEVKHKEYDPLVCCCHTAATIAVQIRSTEAECDCCPWWVCYLDYSVIGDPCGYDVYHTCLFIVQSGEPFWYRFRDPKDEVNCHCEGSYTPNCPPPPR